MIPVFMDASSAIILFKADLIKMSLDAFAAVICPEVYLELAKPSYPGADFFRQAVFEKSIHVFHPDPHSPCSVQFLGGFSGMDKGEQETLLVYDQAKKEKGFVIMDDGKGARFCTRHSIPFINALLVPKIFWYRGLMDSDQADKKMKQISGIGRYGNTILSKAVHLSKTDLSFFTFQD